MGTGVIEDPKNPAKLGITYSYGQREYTGVKITTSCLCSDLWLLLSASIQCSPPLLPLLDPVHWLRELCPGVLLHRRPQALPCGLRLDPGPHPEPAGRHRGEGQGDLCHQQHRRDPDDPQQAAGMWQNSLRLRRKSNTRWRRCWWKKRNDCRFFFLPTLYFYREEF